MGIRCIHLAWRQTRKLRHYSVNFFIGPRRSFFLGGASLLCLQNVVSFCTIWFVRFFLVCQWSCVLQQLDQPQPLLMVFYIGKILDKALNWLLENSLHTWVFLAFNFCFLSRIIPFSNSQLLHNVHKGLLFVK